MSMIDIDIIVVDHLPDGAIENSEALGSFTQALWNAMQFGPVPSEISLQRTDFEGKQGTLEELVAVSLSPDSQPTLVCPPHLQSMLGIMLGIKFAEAAMNGFAGIDDK